MARTESEMIEEYKKLLKEMDRKYSTPKQGTPEYAEEMNKKDKDEQGMAQQDREYESKSGLKDFLDYDLLNSEWGNAPDGTGITLGFDGYIKNYQRVYDSPIGVGEPYVGKGQTLGYDRWYDIHKNDEEYLKYLKAKEKLLKMWQDEGNTYEEGVTFWDWYEDKRKALEKAKPNTRA